MALGHDVTLFASGDSRTSAKLEPGWPRALRLDGAVRDANALHLAMLEHVRKQAHDFDFLHFHLDYYPFSLFARQPTPFLTTLHGRLDLPELHPIFNACPSAPVVSISNAQRRPLPQARWVRTIYHGLPEQAAHAEAGAPVLPRVPRPHRAREGGRPGDPGRAANAASRSRSPPRSTASTASISRQASVR